MVTDSRNETAATHIDRLLHEKRRRRKKAVCFNHCQLPNETTTIAANTEKKQRENHTENEMENEELNKKKKAIHCVAIERERARERENNVN